MWRPRHDMLGSYFEKFSTTTVIRVFNFIRTAPFLVERIFWIVIFVGFTSVTVWDISQTIKKYLSEPTASIVSFPVTSRNGLNFSNANLCVGMNKASLIQLYDSEDVVDEIIKTFASTSDVTKLLKEKLDKFHSTEDRLSRMYFLSSVNDTTNGALFSYYAELDALSFAVLSENDAAFLGLTTVMLEELIETENIGGQSSKQGPVFTAKTARKLYDFYASRHTDFVELLRLTAEATCVLQRVRLVARWQNTNTADITQSMFNVCKRSQELMWLGTGPGGTIEFTCYRLPSNALVFYSVFDRVIITAQVEMLYGDLASTADALTIDLAGTMSAESGQAPLMPSVNQNQMIQFSLETWSTSTNLRRSGCLDRDTAGIEFDCTNWCRAELITKACECVPLISEFSGTFKRALQGTFENCAGVEFTKLAYENDDRCGDALAATVDETRGNCSRRCDKNCDTILYNHQNILLADNNETDAAALNATTFIRLYSLRNVYTRVVEYRTMDEKQLITSLGGNLSLYLGASFLALIHIVVFFVKLPFDIASGRHNTSEKPPQTSTNVNLDSSTTGGKNFDETFALIFAQLVYLRQQGRHTDRRFDRLSEQMEGLSRHINARPRY